MNPQSPPRRPLAPTSINAILASPLPSPSKSSTINTSLRLPPISLNRPMNGGIQVYTKVPQSLPRLDDAISSALRQPLPTGLNNIVRPQPPNINAARRPRPLGCNIGHPQPVISRASPSVAPIHTPLSPAASVQLPKRKADDISTSTFSINNHEGIRHEITENCDQIRRKICRVLNSGDMTMADLVRELDCNSEAFSRFMEQNGPDKGTKNEVYIKAWKFFKRRDIRSTQPTVKKLKKENEEKRNDVSNIKLEGENTLSVRIFDSCDEIRKKIRAHLTEPSVTQAGFLREIAKTYSDGRKIQSKVLNDFLGKRGKYVGNTTAVYYSSYIFFEKMRIRDGKDKSKHRKEMEAEWMDEGGIDIKHRDNGKAYF